jgi:hypothetical protein
MTAKPDLKPDLDFAPIAKRIREGVGLQGFMTHIGAEISELARGTCTLAVDRRILPRRRYRFPGRQRDHNRCRNVARPTGAYG